MKEGKIPWELLQQVLSKTGFKAEGIILGPKTGCDAAVVDCALAAKRAQEFYASEEEIYTVFKTDPITFPTTNPGKYAVIVNANDVATTGALPFGFNATIIVPLGSTPIDVFRIQEGIHHECLKNKIAVLGGHSEISSSVVTPVIAGAMFGFVPKDYYVPHELEENDMMLCVGWCAKEGVGIIASEGYEKLAEHMGSSPLERLMMLGKDISVVDIALKINKKFQPGLMHDATEGGVLAATYEAIAAESFGLELAGEKFPITKDTKELCALLDIDPLKLISSGTLLVVAPESTAKKIMKESTEEIPIEVIGRIVSREKGITIDGEEVPLPEPDAVIAALENIEKGRFK